MANQGSKNTGAKTSKIEELKDSDLDQIQGAGIMHWGDPHENLTADDDRKTKGVTRNAGGSGI